MRADSSKKGSEYITEDCYVVSPRSCDSFSPFSKNCVRHLLSFWRKAFDSIALPLGAPNSTNRMSFHRTLIPSYKFGSIHLIRLQYSRSLMFLMAIAYIFHQPLRPRKPLPTCSLPSTDTYHANPAALPLLPLFAPPNAVYLEETSPFATLPVKKKHSCA